MTAINHLFAACLMMAAQTYEVPPQVLVGILHVEGGRIGQQVGNTNGSYDPGPMQINSRWVPTLADNWGVSRKVAWKWLRDDGCTNVNVAAWILRQHLTETGSLAKAVAYYHSRTPSLGSNYKNKVVEVMRRKGLLTKGQHGSQEQTAANPPAVSGIKRFMMGLASKNPEEKG